jgi:simple sugar transport system ATP-binding protein
VDVGAMEFIHKRIIEQRDAGKPVLIVSTELDEITALSDRIAVMYRGRIVGIVPPDTSNEELGLLMAGSGPEDAARAHEAPVHGAPVQDAVPAQAEAPAEESSETADE